MKIAHIVGNRPQFVKLSPFLKATEAYSDIENVIIHTGQHYDYEMSEVFFEDLGIPEPDYQLYTPPLNNSHQIGTMLTKLPGCFGEIKPDVIVVYGDTSTTLAGALAAYYEHIPLAHVEAGVREYIWRPEEINKKMADHCSDFLFAPIPRATDNLRREGIPEDRIFFTGDITYDAFLQFKDMALEKGEVEIPKEPYILWTMHRAETVNNDNRMQGIIEAMEEIGKLIIFPVHPRTSRIIQKHVGLGASFCDRVAMTQPVGYFDFLKLLINCDLVVTDSSGVLKEAYYAGKNCVTIDETSEYNELFEMGCNVFAGFGKEVILREINSRFGRSINRGKGYLFGDGNAAKRMVDILRRRL